MCQYMQAEDCDGPGSERAQAAGVSYSRIKTKLGFFGVFVKVIFQPCRHRAAML